MYLPVYFNNSIISQLPVYDDLAISWELMGENEIAAQVELPGALNCPIGSYIIYKGLQYTVNTLPSVQETGPAGQGLLYTYNIVFESYQYRLYDKGFKHLKNKTFTFYGDLSEFAYLLVANINDIDSGWSVGFCDDSELKSVDFDKATCRTALDTIAEAFTVEWYISGNGKVINFVKQAGSLTNLVFKYGRNKGLYSLGYQYQNDKNIVTRAFGYGSSRNLPKNYRDGATELMFDGYYLEENVNLYRVKEGDYINEDIFPSIEGHVTSVGAFDPDAATFSITDSGLTFDLNTYFSPDIPKLGFTSGQLQGQEFEIVTYDPASKVIKLKVTQDAAGNNLPNATIQAAIADTYTLFDMYFPDEVVAAAETKLKEATQTWLNENCVPRVLYNLELDPLYARTNGIMLSPGDKITVQDEALGINALIRVTSISYPVNFPDIITPNTKITSTIANFIPYTTTERVISDTIDNQKEIKVVNRTSAERARLNSLNLKKLQTRIFNPDGTLFTGVDSLVAGMATFGYDSQNLNLNDVVISPNLLGDANAFQISSGKLIHYIYKLDGLGYIWTLPLHSWSGLDPAKFYYVYAKCSKSALIGTWEISQTPVSVNDITGYYAFNLGILYEVNTDGYRTFQSTKGVTTIVGDQITSGLIQDITGQNYINLTNGKFNMGDADSGIDWDVTNAGFLTIRGGIASKIIQVGSAGVINARISGITDNGSQSIRFAAGEEDEFNVLDDGTANMSQANITGVINALSGMIGNFSILDGNLSMNEEHQSGVYNQVLIGDNVLPATTPNLKATGIFRNLIANTSLGTGINYAMVLKAANADHNYALYVEKGDLDLGYGAIKSAGFTGIPNLRVQFKGGTGDTRHMVIKNGLIVEEDDGP